jgi:hypothetical protein
MISTLLLSLALGAPAQPFARAAGAQVDDPAIQVWLNEDGRFQRGDLAKVYVRTRADGYLLVLHVDPDNRLRVLFPLDPDDDNFVRGGKKYQILGRGDRESFEVDVRSGRGTVYAAVSSDPFRWDGFIVGDHWDFRALNDVPLTRELEADLNDLVRRLATTDFDYDLVDYDVYERVYASQGTTYYETVHVRPSYYGWDPYYSSWCVGYWRCGGSGLFIGIGIGDPWYYPYAYYPRHYYPYYYPYSYYYPAYHYPYRPWRPYRPYYPYRYSDPYRHRGGTYAGGYYFGGHYAAPWRDRTNDRFYGSTYAWRGREATTDLAQPARFGAGYRGRNLDRESAGSGPLAGATPRRRGSDVPAPNVSPARTEGRRSTAVVANPARGGSEPRRGGERAQAAAPRLPERVGAGADRDVSPQLEPRRNGDGNSAPRREEFAGEASERRGYESGVSAPRRNVEARGPEGRPSRAREVGDDRGSVRDAGPRESRPEPRREAGEPRERPQYEPRPAPRSEPRAEPRHEPRPEPRAEPRRESPPPRMDPRPAPRAEPRSSPPSRGHAGGGRGGRPARRN